MTRLVDVLWGDHPPATATKALQVYVSQLRRALGSTTIVTRSSGYAIDPRAGPARPRALRDPDRRAEDAPPAEAGELLREALALFRGPPLVDAPLLGPARPRPTGWRSCGWPRSNGGSRPISLGRHTALVGELEALVAEHAYRERFHAQLMLAPVPVRPPGRRARGLPARPHDPVEELGLDPGRELQQLEAAILAQDPALDASQARPARGASRPRCPFRRVRCSAATRTSRPRSRCWRTCGCSRSPGPAGSARRGSRSSSPTGSVASSATARG